MNDNKVTKRMNFHLKIYTINSQYKRILKNHNKLLGRKMTNFMQQ